ncbi:hypothetical protein CONCODRAFT_1839, partial [Conidiobolus coronatus NRRL 28638]
MTNEDKEDSFTYIYTEEDSVKSGYPQLVETLKKYFKKSVDGDKKLFITNVENLYDIYLSNIPEEARQHYTCSACRLFINRFGGLVTIDDNGVMKSVIWCVERVPAFFKPAVEAMKTAVLNSRVKSVFIPDSRVLGIPVTGEWTHLSISMPQSMVSRSIIRTAKQLMAEKREDFGVLSRVSSVHTKETTIKAIELLKSETVYRGDRYIPAAKWFKQVVIKQKSITNSVAKENYLWLAT